MAEIQCINKCGNLSNEGSDYCEDCEYGIGNGDTMTKKEFTGKGGETWTWEETPEVTEALKQLHDRVRRAKLKEDDDKLNYDTSGK